MKKATQVFSLIFLQLIGVACYGNTDFDYRVVNEKDTQSVLTAWKERDLSPKDVQIIIDEQGEGFRLLLIKHNVLGSTHFGAIILPDTNDLTNVPVLILPSGLNQENPTIKLDSYVASNYRQVAPYSGFIKVIPSFRGRTMYYKDVGYYSEGDFCDAYDGAADDTIALLSSVKFLYPKANFDDVLVIGGSRGGNVALLMGVRDPRINTIISERAPVDFYREDVKSYYGKQYQCQFLEGKTNAQARQRMLSSSPAHFEPQENLESVFIHHGGQDEVVPKWNANSISNHLLNSGIDVTTFIYPNRGHGDLWRDSSYRENNLVGISRFLKNIGD